MESSSTQYPPAASPANELAQTIEAYDASATLHQAAFAGVVQPLLGDLLTQLTAGSQVLELGCGTGRDLVSIQAEGHQPLGVDLSRGMLELARQSAPEARLVQADARMLPLRAAQFDAVWSSAGLVHLPHEAVTEALFEARRVCVRGAMLALTLRRQLPGQEATGWEDSSFGPRWYARWSIEQLQTALWAASWTPLAMGEEDDSRPGIGWLWATASC